jgi:Flp pilus assembly protein TadD
VRSGLARARRDAALLADLEAAQGSDRGTTGMYPDMRASVRLYRTAFAAAGLPADGDAAALAAAVRSERPGLREALRQALAVWAGALRTPPDPDLDRIVAAADLADTDPIRKEIEAALEASDKAALAQLGDKDLDPIRAANLGYELMRIGMAPDAVRILRRARDRHPSDLSVLQSLSSALRVASPDDPVAIEEAIGAMRAAVAISENRAQSHYELGLIYYESRKDLPAAERQYLRTLELNPRFAFAMINLGWIRQVSGDLAGAERWYRKAAETDTQFPKPHVNLAGLLVNRGDLAGAEAEYRKWIELEPKRPDAHAFLGDVLMRRGDLAGAEAEYRTLADLVPKSPRAQGLLASVRRKAAMLPRLDDVVAGRAAPASPAEALGFADLCYQPFRRQYATAAHLADRALADDPKLADDMAAGNRYNAACFAALAGCGQGTDAPADPGTRANLRGKALAWLRADLAAWTKQVDKPADREKVAAMLAHWLEDSDLAGVRPGPGRIDLPADERSAWEALWGEVRATLTRAQARKPATTPPATSKPEKPPPRGAE